MEHNIIQKQTSFHNIKNYNYNTNKSYKRSNKNYNKNQKHYRNFNKPKNVHPESIIKTDNINILNAENFYPKNYKPTNDNNHENNNENNSVTNNETNNDNITNKDNLSNNENSNIIVLKTSDEFINEILNTYGEQDSFCNFSIFEKIIDINLKPNKEIINKMTLYEYFECFEESSYMCLNVPYVDKNCSIIYNIFNPTLSSLNLLINRKNIKRNNFNDKYIRNNFYLNIINKDLINIQFNESNPPYNRDIIKSKINLIHNILGVKKINISDIDIKTSYFSILWAPADTHKFKSSFLSYYTFNFLLIGTLIIKNEDNSWFKIFCKDKNVFKDYKKCYTNKINEISNFIKKSHHTDEINNLDNHMFSHDFIRFLSN